MLASVRRWLAKASILQHLGVLIAILVLVWSAVHFTDWVPTALLAGIPFMWLAYICGILLARRTKTR